MTSSGPRLLLISNSTQHGSGYLEHCAAEIVRRAQEDASRILANAKTAAQRATLDRSGPTPRLTNIDDFDAGGRLRSRRVARTRGFTLEGMIIASNSSLRSAKILR